MTESVIVNISCAVSNDTVLIYAPLGLLEKTRDNLTSTSVKVVPLTVTSMLNKFQQKILQFGCAIAQKLLAVYH